MRNNPKTDHEAVKVVSYDIEKALSHAELTWAADPFRKVVSKNGIPDFNIDFSRNPSARRRAPRPTVSSLHQAPAGRPPVSLALTRHLGRVETVPSASNRLRQSFVQEEESRRLPASSTTPAPSPQTQKVNNQSSRRALPRARGRGEPRRLDTQEAGTSQRDRASVRRGPTSSVRAPLERNGDVDIIDSGTAIPTSTTSEKTTFFEDFTWTPALLQKHFHKDQLKVNVRQPKNPDDIFVFFRS